MLITVPLPARPVPLVTTTPGARPLMRLPRSPTAAARTSSAAGIVATEFPTARRSTAPACPVTTSAFSSIGDSLKRMRRPSVPTVVRCVCARKPTRRISSVTSPEGKPVSRKRPFASLSVRRPVPCTAICALAMGVSLPVARTVPLITPVPTTAWACKGTATGMASGET